MKNIHKIRIEQLLETNNKITYKVGSWAFENELILWLERDIVHRFWFTDYSLFALFQQKMPFLKARWLCGNGWVSVKVKKRLLAKATPQTFDTEFIYRNNELIYDGKIDDAIFLNKETDVIFYLKSIRILNTSFHFSNEIEANPLLKIFGLNQLY
jgi:hypothetical protein